MTGRLMAALAAAALGTGAAPPPVDQAQALTDLRVLSADAMQGREVGSVGGSKARTYLSKRLKAVGVRPFGTTYEQSFTFSDKGVTRRGANLLGVIQGRRADGPALVVTAHYDHLGVRQGVVFNGADDNASGVAGLLAVAQAFSRERPEHTIVFALLDGEEAGHRGATAFAANPPLPLSRIALNMNMDMISMNTRNELYVAGAWHRPSLAPRLRRLAESVPVRLKLGHDGPPWTGTDDWTAQSDHFAFHKAGVPWVYFGVEDHPRYHKPDDDFEAVPRDFFARALTTVVMAARAFDADLDEIAAEAAVRPPRPSSAASSPHERHGAW